MHYNNSQRISYTGGFFLLIGISLIGLTIAIFLAQTAWQSMTGTNMITATAEQPPNPAFTSAYRVVQTIFVVFGMLVPAFIVAWLPFGRPVHELGLDRSITLRQLLWTLLVMLLSIFLAGALGYVNALIPVPADWKAIFDKMELEYVQQVKVILGDRSPGNYIVSLFLLALFPAICEELFFRGGLQHFLHRATKKPWLAIIVVSVIFSLVHFSFFGFLPRMFLGVVLGMIYYFTRNLWLCMLCHFLNNAMAITQLYFTPEKDVEKAMAGQQPYYYLGFLALPVFILAARKLKRTGSPELTF